MSEEQIREIAKETFAENIMNNLDSSIVFKYIQELEQENKIYKEVINELKNYLEARIEVCDNRLSTPFCNFEKTTKERLILSQCLEKLEELEAEDK